MVIPLRVCRSLAAVMAFVTFGCGESSRNPVGPDAVTLTNSVGDPLIVSTPAGNGGDFQSTVETMASAVVTSGARRPLTESRPYEAVCEAQGGLFEVAVDFSSLYCSKEGALFTAFTESQLDVQRTLCGRMYGGFFGVFGEVPNTTVTFCTTSSSPI